MEKACAAEPHQVVQPWSQPEGGVVGHLEVALRFLSCHDPLTVHSSRVMGVVPQILPCFFRAGWVKWPFTGCSHFHRASRCLKDM